MSKPKALQIQGYEDVTWASPLFNSTSGFQPFAAIIYGPGVRSRLIWLEQPDEPYGREAEYMGA